MKCRNACLEDIESITQIHIKAFPQFFMTSLGSKFLYEYYRLYLNSSDHIAIVIEEFGVVKGFAVGTNDSLAFYKEFKINSYKFIYPILINFSNVKLLKKILKRILSIFNGNKIDNREIVYENFNELTSIALNPRLHTQGAGGQLFVYYEKICKDNNIGGIHLTTDKLNNYKVLNFYNKHGFVIKQEFYQDDLRAMYSLVKSF